MLAQFLPRDIYLDTSVVVAATIVSSPLSAAGNAFCAALEIHRSRIYFSQVLRLEFSQAVRNLATRRAQLPDEVRRQHQLDHWDTSDAVRHHWMQFGIAQLEGILNSFEVIELPFETEIWERSVEIMALNQLKSLDAVHVATARAYGLRHFATLDDDFNRIVDLRVWLIRDETA